MKMIPLLAIAVLAISLPASAQSASQLKQENERLKEQVEMLKAQVCDTQSRTGHDWSQGELNATVDAIRVGRRSNHPGQPDGHVAVTLTLHNTGSLPIALNYQSGTFRLVDEAGGEYRATLQKAGGIPTSTRREADPTAVIDAGGTRAVTFNAFRVPSSTDSLPRRFDINAIFIQVEDQGQGRTRKVRDFPVGFTNVPASGS